MVEDLENNLVELRSELFTKVAECNMHVKECCQEQDRLKIQVSDVKTHLDNVKIIMKMREDQFAVLSADNLQQRKDLSQFVDLTNGKFKNLGDDVSKRLDKSNRIIVENTDRLTRFEEKVHMDALHIQELQKKAVANLHKINDLDIQKMDTKYFDDIIKQKEARMETARKAAVDNFEQSIATDNYLEKYLPFRMQKMISASLYAFLGRIPQPEVELTDEDKLVLKQLSADAQAQHLRDLKLQRCPKALYQAFEEKEFKQMHKVAMADLGIPNLKKRGVYMPGHAEVMEIEEREGLFGRMRDTMINSPTSDE